MTANMSELEAAIAAGLEELKNRTFWGDGDNLEDAVTDTAAFASYREQVASLQAENARLRDALRPFAKTWANYQTDELGNRDHKSFLFWLFYFSEMSNDYVDSAAAHAQAAALADVETHEP